MKLKQWLRDTTAADIMVSDVLTLRDDLSVEDASIVLIREQITGAPVVNEAGKCIGVLSMSDLVGAEDKAATLRDEIASSSFFHSSLALPASLVEAELEKVRDKLLPAAEQPISRFMTTDLVSVRRHTPLLEIVQDMVVAHVHRLLVVDDADTLVGIVSTTDILAALLREDCSNVTSN